MRFSVLLVCDRAHLLFYEQRAIDILQPRYNVCRTAGSPKGRRHTPESLAKIRAAMTTPAMRANLSAKTKANRTPEHIANIALAVRAHVWTPEKRKLMSDKMKARITPEIRAGLSARMLKVMADPNEREKRRRTTLARRASN